MKTNLLLPLLTLAMGVNLSSELQAHVLTRLDDQGSTYPVTEVSIFGVLKDYALEAERSGEIKAREKANRDRLKAWANAPIFPVRVPRAIKDTEAFLDFNDKIATLSPPLQKALRGHERTWLFIDASDALQLRWARETLAMHRAFSGAKKIAVVLVGGRLDRARRFLKERVFADQGHAMCRSLFINEVPTMVTLKAGQIHRVTFAIKETK